MEKSKGKRSRKMRSNIYWLRRLIINPWVTGSNPISRFSLFIFSRSMKWVPGTRGELYTLVDLVARMYFIQRYISIFIHLTLSIKKAIKYFIVFYFTKQVRVIWIPVRQLPSGVVRRTNNLEEHDVLALGLVAFLNTQIPISSNN